jgi:hypothetical protein
VAEGDWSGVAAGLRHQRCKDGPPGRIDRGRVFWFGGCTAVERFDSTGWLAVGWMGRAEKVDVPVF